MSPISKTPETDKLCEKNLKISQQLMPVVQEILGKVGMLGNATKIVNETGKTEPRYLKDRTCVVYSVKDYSKLIPREVAHLEVSSAMTMEGTRTDISTAVRFERKIGLLKTEEAGAYTEGHLDELLTSTPSPREKFATAIQQAATATL